MAKRDSSSKRTGTAPAKATTKTAATATGDAMEQRVLAFAEQLGRIVGTVQAKTEGWMDRDALNKQIAGVRDSAAELLEQLKSSVADATGNSNTDATTASATAATAARNKGRSGGVVDAPGKKHRKPTPKDSRAVAADAKASNTRAGLASMKTMKRRGRG